jgi:hypothetical protein
MIEQALGKEPSFPKLQAGASDHAHDIGTYCLSLCSVQKQQDMAGVLVL